MGLKQWWVVHNIVADKQPKTLETHRFVKNCPPLSGNCCFLQLSPSMRARQSTKDRCFLQALRKSFLAWTFAPRRETQRGGFGHCTTVCEEYKWLHGAKMTSQTQQSHHNILQQFPKPSRDKYRKYSFICVKLIVCTCTPFNARLALLTVGYSHSIRPQEGSILTFSRAWPHLISRTSHLFQAVFFNVTHKPVIWEPPRCPGAHCALIPSPSLFLSTTAPCQAVGDHC